MNPRKTEMIEQARALELMGMLTVEDILLIGAEMRGIVEGFEKLTGEPPAASDIVWVLSERRGHDMRKKIKN